MSNQVPKQYPATRETRMRMKTCQSVCFVIACLASPCWAVTQDTSFDTAAIKEFLHRNFDGKNAGMVIGVVDEHGSQIFAVGKLDNGADQEVNGDTLFEIGSITKTFTTLLLQDMIERGEMNVEDPVANYLPKSVKMPNRNGKEITLLQLATHTSGLPTSSILDSKRADNP